jgi:hypothetical protein
MNELGNSFLNLIAVRPALAFVHLPHFSGDEVPETDTTNFGKSVLEKFIPSASVFSYSEPNFVPLE